MSSAEIEQKRHAADDQLVASMLGSIVDGEPVNAIYHAPDVDITSYDHIIVCFSGGKDSFATLLRLFEMGADKSKIELWHHHVDGMEGSTLMDWPHTEDYCRKVAAHFDLPIYFSWLEGGFEGEMTKLNSHSKPHHVETPDGKLILPRDQTRPPSTRMKFPQTAGSLATRWCSSSLKIDVGRRALNNQPRFDGKKVLFCTGERREESAKRSGYNQLEIHACDRRNGRKRRQVDAWRTVLHLSEQEVWDTLKRHKIQPPVPYRLGWGRFSCMGCIFNGPQIWATANAYFPEKVTPIARYETQFETTISRSRVNVIEIAKKAEPLKIDDAEALTQAMSPIYTLPITTDEWILPPGAFSHGCSGPT